ncbi:DUF2141 domain-containing protein [Agaribacterium sp. ZY112]|uniref:DUF2141 domain-containing protein n=1 Tax=Agaribacterium sp. ZY112 TaxID=3233574 RepID=UPI00352562E7
MMKHLFYLTMGVTLMSQPVKADKVQIEINNIDTGRSGLLRVMLFAEDGFPKNHQKAIFTQSIGSDKSTVSVLFFDIPDSFAIKVLHDENEDGKVSKNWTGILPKEGLAFSNGARIRFGPPSFKSARIERKNMTVPVSINMIYP